MALHVGRANLGKRRHGSALRRGWRPANLDRAATLLLGSVGHLGRLSTGLAPGY